MRFPIQMKLYAIGFIPMIVILFYTLQNIYKEYTDYRQSESLQRSVAITTAVNALVHAIQLECGLSVSFLEQPGKQHVQKLLESQYTRTDPLIKAFKNELTLFLAHTPSAEPRYNDMRQKLTKIGPIRHAAERRLIGTAELFEYYSDINSDLIAIIDNFTLYSYNKEVTLAADTLKQLTLLQEQAGQERVVMTRIFSSVELSTADYLQLQKLIVMQKHRYKDAMTMLYDPQMRTKLERLFMEDDRLDRYRNYVLHAFEKNNLLSEIRSLTGYGGMIHTFKNYLVRADERYYEKFLTDYEAFNKMIAAYRKLITENPGERTHLDTIATAFAHYRTNIEAVKQMIAVHLPVNAIDRQIYVDDSGALTSMRALHNHVIGVDPDQWFAFATERIEQLQQLETELLQHLSQTILTDQQQAMKRFRLEVTLGGFILFLIMLMGHIVSKQMIASIENLNTGMHEFFRYINYESAQPQRILIVSNDEISDMVSQINAQIALAHQHFQQDDKFIREATSIVKAMKNGSFTDALHVQPFNPSLATLKDIFNEMIAIIQEKIARQTRELEIINNSLSEKVNEQTLKLREQLQELSQFKRAIDESLIVSHISNTQKITGLSGPYLQMTGFDLQEMLNKSSDTLLDGTERELHLRKIFGRVLNKKNFHGHLPLQKRDGSLFLADSTIIPLIDTSGSIREFLGIHHDITPIIEARDVAIAAEKSKDEFLSNMSHEIRTPLNAILGFVAILQKRIHDEKALEFLEIIDSSGKLLLSIINDILDFSKMQAGKFLITEAAFEPVHELSVAAKLFSSKAAEKQQSYLVYIDPNLPQCLNADIVRIKQILSNLLSNAMKFTPKNGCIKVRITYQDGFLCIVVQDNGIGIPKIYHEKIFEPFEQADGSTTRNYGGTGLGLSISAKLARLMGGELNMQSTEAQGSIFTFSLPCERCYTISRSQYPYDKIRSLNIGFIENATGSKNILDLLSRYLMDFGITNVIRDCTPDDNKADLLLFIPEPRLLERITAINKPAIALLTTSENDTLQDHPHIFVLHTPFVPADVIEALESAAVERLRAEEPKEQRVQTPRFKGRVLIAEDNKTNQMLIAMLLDNFGLESVIVENGLEAVETFKKEPFDLVLMDENMPKLNGIAAMKAMKAYETEAVKAPTPIIALTANVMQGDRQHFLDEGMDDFIGKPIDINTLQASLKKFLKPEG